MKVNLDKRTGVIIIALVLFLSAARPVLALVLNENVYTIPDGGAELLLGDSLPAGSHIYNSINAGVGLGIFTDFSVWFRFSYLSCDNPNPFEGSAGDGIVHMRYYLGDYAQNRLHMVLFSTLRVPAGNNAYTSDRWKNVSFGNNEISAGTAARYDFLPSWFIHAMFSYTFRQDRVEDFYGGFYLNPLKGETWKSLFGLNPMRNGSFLHYKHLKNDYITMGLGLSTDRLFPFIPACEARWSITTAGESVKRYPVPPFGVDPLVFSVEGRYFFSRRFYAGCYCAANVLSRTDGTVFMPGFSLGLEF